MASVALPPSPGAAALSGPPPRAFCVALGPSGPIKLTGESPQDFASAVAQASIAWIDLTVGDMAAEAHAAASSLGFSPSLVTSLMASPLSAYEDLETELGIAVPAVRVQDLKVSVSPLLILLRKGLILTLHTAEVGRLGRLYRYADIFMKKIKPNLAWNDRLTVFLVRILDENNDRNFAGLQKIEEQGGKIGQALVEPATIRPEVGPEIWNMKQGLLAYLDTLWATLDVIHSLRWGDAEVITDDPKLLQRIVLLGDDLNRHVSLTEMMSGVLAQGLEVLHSIYNNQLTVLNNRITYVALVMAIAGTAFFLPNTLATIGPEALGVGRGSPMWVPLLLLSSVGSGLFVYAIIRLKGWLPRSPGKAFAPPEK